jgi:molecular chaperone HscB
MPDPFQTLGLPRRFDLDEADLHARFIHASSTHHPDRHTDPVLQAEAAEQSAEINHAYAVLSDPERRADTLLTLLGGPAKDQDKSLPPALLMDMMVIREQLEETVAENNEAELEKLRAWANGQRETHLAKVAELFDGEESTLPDAKAKSIRLELNTLRYIERMLEQMPAG